MMIKNQSENKPSVNPPDGYIYRGYDPNPYLPKRSGHYWRNGYATWRPLKEKTK